MNTFKITTVLIIAAALFGQSVSWTTIDNAGSFSLPETPPPSAEDLAHAAAVGSTYVAPPEASPEAKRAYEAYVDSLMQSKHPPVYILDVTLPASRGAMERERLEDGHMMRSGRIYLKPRVIFDDPELRTPIIRVAPITRGIVTATLTTVQEAEAAMDIDLVAHSMKTPEGELYIDITEIVNAMESGRIGTKLLLSPLSPRESFTLPEPSDMGGMPGSEGDLGSPFEIILTE